MDDIKIQVYMSIRVIIFMSFIVSVPILIPFMAACFSEKNKQFNVQSILQLPLIIKVYSVPGRLFISCTGLRFKFCILAQGIHILDMMQETQDNMFFLYNAKDGSIEYGIEGFLNLKVKYKIKKM